MHGLIEQAKSWLDAGMGLFYPNICQICNSQPAQPTDGYVCGRCRQGVRLITPPYCDRCGLPYEGQITTSFECSNCQKLDLQFAWARAAVAAKGVVREAIHHYKYHRCIWFEPFLADLLVRQATPTLHRSDWDFIVPVPLHPLKKRDREFNQAERLARHLSRSTGIPVRSDLLHRTSATKTQTALSRSARAANVGLAFSLTSDQKLDGQRILLIDDVLTTGATTSACAKALRQNGAATVAVWTVARGL